MKTEHWSITNYEVLPDGVYKITADPDGAYKWQWNKIGLIAGLSTGLRYTRNPISLDDALEMMQLRYRTVYDTMLTYDFEPLIKKGLYPMFENLMVTKVSSWGLDTSNPDPNHMHVWFTFEGKYYEACMGEDLNHVEHAYNRFVKRVREGFYAVGDGMFMFEPFELVKIPATTRVYDMRVSSVEAVEQVKETPTMSQGEYRLAFRVNGFEVDTRMNTDLLQLLRTAQQFVDDYDFASLYNFPWVIDVDIYDTQGVKVAYLDLSENGKIEFY